MSFQGGGCIKLSNASRFAFGKIGKPFDLYHQGRCPGGLKFEEGAHLVNRRANTGCLGDLSVSPYFKNRIGERVIKEHLAGGFQNSPYPSNVAPTTTQQMHAPETEDFQLLYVTK